MDSRGQCRDFKRIYMTINQLGSVENSQGFIASAGIDGDRYSMHRDLC